MVDPSVVRHLQSELLATTDPARAKEILQRLKAITMNKNLLRETMVAKSVKAAARRIPAVKKQSKELIRLWRQALQPQSRLADPLRKSVVAQFLSVLGSERHAQVLEEEIFRSCEKAEYRAKARSVRFNLGKNEALKEKVLAGKISCKELAGMTTLEMATESTQQQYAVVQREQTEARRLDWNVVHNEPTSGLFQCPNCSSKWTLTEQKQILSADEPMTLFIQCVECSTSWQV